MNPNNLTGSARKDYFRKWRTAADTDVKDFSLMGRYKDAKAMDHFGRAGSFLGFGSGAKRENFTNAFGFLTKNQKNSFLNKMLIPLGSAYVGYDALSRGDPADFFATGLGFATGLTAARPMAEIGHGIGKAIGMGGGARILGYGLGGVAGLSAGLATYGAATVIASASKNNNFIQQTAMKLNRDLMTSSGLETNNTLTSRQRALSKLSRAGLNDRGQLLSNEAMILKGLL